MRGISTPWMIMYAITLIFVVAFLPGIIGITNASASGIDNKSDPGYLATLVLPLVFFGLFLFKPWRETESY